MSRPFRFGVNLISAPSGEEWRTKCRRAEELGMSVPEPWMEQFATVIEALRAE